MRVCELNWKVYMKKKKKNKTKQINKENKATERLNFLFYDLIKYYYSY